MKKELLNQFETLIRGHIGEFYTKAYSVKGNRAEAEALTEEAIVWGASKFSGLANKERVVDLIVARIGGGAYTGTETTNESALWARTAEKIRSRNRTPVILTAVVSFILLLGIGIGVAIGLSQDEPNPGINGGVIIDDGVIIEGENVNFQLNNYHNLTSALGTKATFKKFVDRMKFVDYFAAAVTAPDGNIYAVYQNFEEENGNNTTFTLYRANQDGWESVGVGNISSVFVDDTYGGEYAPSYIYIMADSSSDVYIFCVLDEAIVAYRFDSEKNALGVVSLDIPFTMALKNKFWMYYDESQGENGTVYIACLNGGTITLYSYDIKSGSTVLFTEKFNVGSGADIVLTAKNDIIYMVTQNGLSGWVINYYSICRNQKPSKFELSQSDNWVTGEVEHISNKNFGSGGIAIDGNNNVHILTTYKSSKTRYVKQYVFDSIGNFVGEYNLSPLQFEDGGYFTECASVFTGKDGKLYYIEIYKGLNNYISIGMLDEMDYSKSIYISSFELFENIDLGRIKQNNFDFLFYGEDEQIYYFSLSMITESK